jgi:hypothetical protein
LVAVLHLVDLAVVLVVAHPLVDLVVVLVVVAVREAVGSK